MAKKPNRVLVLYLKLGSTRDRNTIDEHLYSFRRYVTGVRFDYFNAGNGLPRYLTYPSYDAVILHYTFLAARWSPDFYRKWRKGVENLRDIKGYKVAIPQDEYAETEKLWELFRLGHVKTVFSCFTGEDLFRAYPPEKTDLSHWITVIPGYVDEKAAERLAEICTENRKRTINVGYRARNLPFWLGRHGQIKVEIGRVFQEKAKESGLKVDISCDTKDAFIGQEWYKFLCRCKAILGCEGGASLFDPTGKIRQKVEQYLQDHPDANFDEVEENCFRGMDYNIKLFCVSPRHFEAAITKTCQVLVEGNYGGIFKPGVHFIEVKRDFSNLDEVIHLLKDDAYCRKIAENAYRDIVVSGMFSYGGFANKVINHIEEVSEGRENQVACERAVSFLIGKYIALRELFDPLMAAVFYAWLGLKFYKLEALKRFFGSAQGRQ